MPMLDKTGFGDERVEELVAAAVAMRPYLLGKAPLHEKNRRLDDEVIRKLVAADMFKVAAPRRCADHVQRRQSAGNLHDGRRGLPRQRRFSLQFRLLAFELGYVRAGHEE
jgi:hypothetical protein